MRDFQLIPSPTSKVELITLFIPQLDQSYLQSLALPSDRVGAC